MARMTKKPSAATRRNARQSTPPKDPAPAPVQAPRRRARAGGVAMREAVPEVGHTGRQEAPPPMIDPPPAFWLIVAPNRWDVIGDDDPQLVPAVYTQSVRKGQNGVSEHPRTGKPLPAAALAQIEENGHIVIPWDVDGPGTSYLRQEPQTGGWFTRWEEVFSGSADIRADSDGYAAWLRSLVDRGKIPECPVHVIERLIERYSRNADRYRGSGKDAYDAILVRTEAKLQVLLRELERAGGGADAAPVATSSAMPDVDVSTDPNDVHDEDL